MPIITAPTATLTLDELAALAAEIEPLASTNQRHGTATSQRIEAVCERYGLILTDTPSAAAASR
ncbi:hypothetical protein [Actinoplanes sp. NPDC049118]|uniref:hypothetical protein n=1 Tax=Actinoplanes sp. NPDC049118 TaxID=3155769 RepID=UPI00340B30FE